MAPVSGSVSSHYSHRSRALWGRIVLFAAILAGTASFTLSGDAQRSKPEEYQVKAVYLFNFGRFIEWPESAAKDESFTICVLGLDPFGSALDATLAGEAIGSRKLVARRIMSTREVTNCRILFISSSEVSHIKEILSSLEKSNILTVSDMPGFTSNGGMIQFVLKENKVRFEVNLTAAEKAGLTFSSQLLKVATDVKKESPGGGVSP